jgi:hypothetical protein
MGGHRPMTASATLTPFIEPNMSISVKTMVMLRRASSTRIASSALAASMNFKAGFLDHVDRVHANEGLVLDEEDHLLSRCFFHGLNLLSAELSSFKKGGF